MTTSLAPAPARSGRGSIRQHLDQRVHPASLAPLLDLDLANPSAFCGGCAHSVLKKLHDGQDRLKCGLRPRGSRGLRGPDLRDLTPACAKYAERADTTLGN
ncbi:hypothetical protein OG369_39810 [Streptomyces sp. NBC_01221]|uniref:hypothetical protein n=1 Tax=Streptomyces sp. NBC_01221 TaxID=2903782 RepID=UPI0022579FA4|nr:hypothetical protein [Streptomyces sp. NBC_01221]MCX4791997.1 hypothetical protein [Streptomyces sp. NBC_01221]